MSEADTIRDALAPMGPSRRARIDAALTALERRAEQAETHLSKHCGGGLRCPHGSAHSVIGQHRPGDGQ